MFAGLGVLALGGGVGAHLWRLGVIGGDADAAAGEAILTHRYQGLDGKPAVLDGLRGQVLIVNFWATWCEPCREEIPLFIRLRREYAGKRVEFVGISIDQAVKVIEFAKDFQIDYPLVLAGMEAVELSRRAGNKAGVLPFTVILDRNGRLAGQLLGKVTEDALRQSINLLI
jgi:thiol-disulfide isomerase/thioredoxin